MKRILLLLPLLLATTSSARATIYADLFQGTVTGRNDGLADVVITDGTETMRTVAEAAKSPPGTQALKPHEKLTVPMNRAGFKYYSDEFERLKRQGIEALRNKAELERNAREWEEEQRRAKDDRKKALKGIADGLKKFADDMADDMQPQNTQGPRNCTTNFIGNSAFTSCY